jgi:hypothetical protein
MSHLLVLLVLFVTILLSSPFSSSGLKRVPRFSIAGWMGIDAEEIPGAPFPPGSVLEISISAATDHRITSICITEESPEVKCESPDEKNLPIGTQLISSNTAVASVSLDPTVGTVITLKSVGSTILQLRRDKEIFASYVLVVTPPLPGTRCEFNSQGQVEAIVDCSGNCVLREVAGRRLGDKFCDNGSPRDDGSGEVLGIDLSCVFIPEFFVDRADLFVNVIDPFADRTQRDGGDCDPKESCTAQFGTAPGFAFCSASAGVCSFNATTGGGTCADMCQRFGSRCVAALDNSSPGCIPSPNSRDTCQTPRQTEICVCERR